MNTIIIIVVILVIIAAYAGMYNSLVKYRNRAREFS